MNLAHMVGEHHHDSLLSGLVHTVFSWAGLIIAIIISVAVGVPLYVKSRKSTAKEQIKKC